MIRHNKVLSTRIRVSWNRIWKSVTGCNCLQEFENPLDPQTLESGSVTRFFGFEQTEGRFLKKRIYLRVAQIFWFVWTTLIPAAFYGPFLTYYFYRNSPSIKTKQVNSLTENATFLQ